MYDPNLDDYSDEASGFQLLKFSAFRAVEAGVERLSLGPQDAPDAIMDPRSYSKITSPIERNLIAQILRYLMVHSWPHEAFLLEPGQPFGVPRGQKVCIAPQHRVGRFAVDIAMQRFGGPKVAIECDGHDYHERTKQQAAYDRYRDRYIASRGWVIARFTGSEIHHDAYDCVCQIATLLEGEEID